MSQDLNAGIHSQIAGLEKKTGQPISYWVDMVRSWNEPKHMANVKRLKEEFGIGHGHANMIVHLTKENTSLHMDESQLEDSVFKGKEHWKPLCERVSLRACKPLVWNSSSAVKRSIIAFVPQSKLLV
ncbi:DUF4287 domain-containing protein [Schleiferiaceae bacterium]|nr:DUF4287 domain-containing protein [Schleiferiaceae bacterium]